MQEVTSAMFSEECAKLPQSWARNLSRFLWNIARQTSTRWPQRCRKVCWGVLGCSSRQNWLTVNLSIESNSSISSLRMIFIWSSNQQINSGYIFESLEEMSMEDLGLGFEEKEKEKGEGMLAKADEEQRKLIEEEPAVVEGQSEEGTDIIDPLEELTKNNNIVPLLAVLPMIDLNLELNGKPLLNKLCTLSIPLSQHLRNREIVFKNDADNRTALHQAIAADDTQAANWCLENGVGNVKDNFGSSPIGEAIKLGRKSCFLLCLQHSFYDSEAPHMCAMYNRVWQLKVLHRMGYDVVSTRDSEHFTPLERAVANYAYDAAEYLSEITDNISINYLATKTDSQGIIRTIAKSRQRNSVLNKKILPVLKPALALLVIYICINLPQITVYSNYQQPIESLIKIIAGLYALMFALGWFSGCKKEEFSPRNINIPALLGAPEFPHFVQVCPECLGTEKPNTQHCSDCGKCVQRLHFHTFTCVNSSNQALWFVIEVFWMFLVYQLHDILVTQLKLSNFLILTFSTNFFFGNAAIIDQLLADKLLLGWFIFLKIFLIYQFFVCFQWLCMLVQLRTHREINNTQNYPKLYQIVQASDGSYKNMERKLMLNGCLMATTMSVVNIFRYFFR